MFKVKTATIDIDLDLSDVNGIEEKDKILKPIVIPYGDKVVEWGNKVQALKPKGDTETEVAEFLKEKFDGNITKAAESIAENIDFWYGKGMAWWMGHFDMATILKIFSFLTKTVFQVKKK